MTASLTSKDQLLIFIALVIIYLGLYTLQSNNIPAGSRNDARWAGIFSVTLGIFVILSTFLRNPTGRSPPGFGIFLIIALLALVASAFFNIRLARDASNGAFRYLIFAQIAAHVILLLVYLFELGDRRRAEIFREGSYYGAATGHPVDAPGANVPVRVNETIRVNETVRLTSPQRLPVRVR